MRTIRWKKSSTNEEKLEGTDSYVALLAVWRCQKHLMCPRGTMRHPDWRRARAWRRARRRARRMTAGCVCWCKPWTATEACVGATYTLNPEPAITNS